jgi:hypothetical protein
LGLALRYGSTLHERFKRHRDRHIEISTCRHEDVQAVYELAVGHFGEGVTPPDQIHRILARHRTGLKTAHWVGGGQPRELCGYFFVIPINRSLATKIHMDRFKVVDIDVDDIPRQPRYAYATYIGGIVGIGKPARHEILGALKAALDNSPRTKSGLVYAKAATEAGLRALDGYKFRPVHTKATGIDCYYYRDIHPANGAPKQSESLGLAPAFA